MPLWVQPRSAGRVGGASRTGLPVRRTRWPTALRQVSVLSKPLSCLYDSHPGGRWWNVHACVWPGIRTRCPLTYPSSQFLYILRIRCIAIESCVRVCIGNQSTVVEL